MPADGHREVERKYDVPADTPMPLLHELPGVSTVEQPVAQRLEATYVDTPELALANGGVTLRRRTGGEDAGWHLKLRVGTDERLELHAPIEGDGVVVPESLHQLVRVHVRDRPLEPVVRLATRRLVHRLRGADGVLADVCDDTVTATGLRAGDAEASWREWEVELVDGPTDLLDDADALLRDGGASPAAVSSKFLRALGDDPALGRPAPAEPGGPDERAGTAVLAYVAGQVADVKRRDPLVRIDEPDAVHKMRVATRRLRSVLATYRPIFDRSMTDPIREELKWLADLLGDARDAEVMEARHRELVAAQPAELVLGPVARRLDAVHAEERRAALPPIAEALDSARYFRLLDALDALVTTRSWTAAGDEPADDVLKRRLRKDWKRLRRRYDAAESADFDERDSAIHETRKAAKRLRYASEVLDPVYGDPAKRVAKAAERIQDLLGEHHDSVMSRATLRRVGVQAHLDGENAFSYGLLHGLEQARADDSQRQLPAAYKKVSRRLVRVQSG